MQCGTPAYTTSVRFGALSESLLLNVCFGLFPATLSPECRCGRAKPASERVVALPWTAVSRTPSFALVYGLWGGHPGDVNWMRVESRVDCAVARAGSRRSTALPPSINSRPPRRVTQASGLPSDGGFAKGRREACATVKLPVTKCQSPFFAQSENPGSVFAALGPWQPDPCVDETTQSVLCSSHSSTKGYAVDAGP